MAFLRPRGLTTRPTVPVVVPYNYGRFLPEPVHSALNQDHIHIDVLSVDDASTDDSADVARSLAQIDERADVLLHEPNVGHVRSVNDGLNKTRGSYVAVLSADDLLTWNALNRAASLMEHQPRVGLLYGVARRFNVTPPPVPLEVRNSRVWPGAEWLDLTARRGRNVVRNASAVTRRTALEEPGGYDPRVPHAEDFDMWLPTAVNWDVGWISGAAQAFYRVHGSNIHLTAGGMIADLRERRKTFEILFDERAPQKSEVTRLRRPAIASLARDALRQALAPHRAGAEPSTVREYLDYALHTCPETERTLLWKFCEFGPLSELRLPAVRARQFASEALEGLRGIRHRGYGTDMVSSPSITTLGADRSRANRPWIGLALNDRSSKHARRRQREEGQPGTSRPTKTGR